MGLNPPIGIWLNKELKYIINDYLSEESIKKRGLFDYNYVKILI